ncbi:hypothetical protein DFQ26_003449 [Actinomortierella ambigua]|nr:hypothetical protein DFQ26_003449 [Actinomortierella ambigua]
MCILLWTLPDNNHPRFKFVFASNRDEFMRRPASRPAFWDLATILQRPAVAADGDSHTPTVPLDLSSVGILSSLDTQPALKAEDYDIEIACSSNPEDQSSNASHFHVQAKNIPGTWLGITTHGDLVALTNYREELTYRPPAGFVPLSRGKVPSEYLASMAASHAVRVAVPEATDVYPVTTSAAVTTTTTTPLTSERRDLADAWIHKLAERWEKDFEGFNLLVVHEGGSKQYVGSNREGAEVHILAKDNCIQNGASTTTTSQEKTISSDSVAGVSNSVFPQPWTKVKRGTRALTNVLNKNLEVFGSNPSLDSELYDDQTELAWMVIQLLTMMRIHTSPFVADCTTPDQIYAALRERVFIPQVGVIPMWGPGAARQGGLPPASHDYGTRSSTIVLFGRRSNIAVYVEKVWYDDWDTELGHRPEYAADSAEGLVWWQGEIGQPPASWKQIQGDELEQLLMRAKSIEDPKSVL